MKKTVLIIITLIVVILIAGAIWYYDNTRIIEKPLDSVVQIAKSKDGDNITGFPYAYTIEKTNTEITLTLYMADDAVKSIYTFKIIDGIIKDTHYEKHYVSKIGAKLDENVVVNKKVKGNIVSGQLESSLEAIGKNADEYYEKLKNAYSHLEYLK